MKIDLKLKTSDTANEAMRRKKIEIDIATVITETYRTIPISERHKIKIIDAEGKTHKYKSLNHITNLYRKQGAIEIKYEDKEPEETGDFIPSDN